MDFSDLIFHTNRQPTATKTESAKNKEQGSDLIDLRLTWREMENFIFGGFMRIFGEIWRIFGEIKGIFWKF